MSCLDNKRAVKSLVQLPDGNLLVGSIAGRIKGFAEKNGHQVHDFEAHKHSVNSLVLLNNTNFGSCSDDGQIKIWKKDGTPLKTLSEHNSKVNSMVFNIFNMVSVSSDKTIRVWDFNTWTLTRTINYSRHKSLIISLALCENGLLFTGTKDGGIIKWNLTSGEDLGAMLYVHKSAINSLVLLNNEQAVASASVDGWIKIWNSESGDCLRAIEAHKSAINCMILLRDGSLATGSDDRTVKIWDGTTFGLVKTLPHKSEVMSMAFMGDNSWLACGCSNSDILIWK
jgi:WD40 repeat protein